MGKKSWKSFGLLAAASCIITGCHSGGMSAPQQQTAETGAQERIATLTATLWVKGLGCPQCATNIDRQFAKIPGVKNVEVNLGNGKVTVHLKEGAVTTREQLADAIRRGGFTLDKMETP